MTAQRQPNPAAQVLTDAAQLIAEMQRMQARKRVIDNDMRLLCRAYDLHTGCSGTAPVHLERAARLQGFL